MSATTKEALHRLVDALPEARLGEADFFIEIMTLVLAAADDPRLVDFSRRVATAAEERRPSPIEEDAVLQELRAIRKLLASRADVDPVLLALDSAPEDDEPLAPDDAVVLDRRRAAAASGRTISDAEAAQKLGR